MEFKIIMTDYYMQTKRLNFRFQFNQSMTIDDITKKKSMNNLSRLFGYILKRTLLFVKKQYIQIA